MKLLWTLIETCSQVSPRWSKLSLLHIATYSLLKGEMNPKVVHLVTQGQGRLKNMQFDVIWRCSFGSESNFSETITFSSILWSFFFSFPRIASHLLHLSPVRLAEEWRLCEHRIMMRGERKEKKRKKLFSDKQNLKSFTIVSRSEI